MQQIIFFDCDSTLSAIEGIDELARLRGPETFAAVEAMTRKAMDGGAPVEEVFARRLALIRPSAAEVRRVGELYIQNVEPDAVRVLAELVRAGWTPVIVSGGFTEAILPLAGHLGIRHVEAVGLRFDAAGAYAGFAQDAPPTRSRGKNQVIARYKAAFSPRRTAAIGDGASDFETAADVDVFVGFGRYAAREKLRAAAPFPVTDGGFDAPPPRVSADGAIYYTTALASLPAILARRFGA
jgi:phosphoserine phosphatase